MDVALLQSHEVLEGIPHAALESIAQKCRTVILAPNEVLLRPGEPNHTSYFVLSGQLDVHLDSLESGNCFPITAGEVVGEMSLIEHQPVSAWVVAARASTLLAMPEEVFWEDFLSLPAVGRKLLQLMVERLRRRDSIVLKEFERKVHYEHLQRELESAGKIQAHILPALPLFPKRPEVETHAFIKPARQVGGDFFDAFPVNEHCILVAAGDVSGKGMAAALFMVRVISLLRMCVMREERVEDVLPSLNRVLWQGNDNCMFVTLAVGLLETDTGRLTYLNGGHNAPLLSLGRRPFELWEPPRGALLGVDPDAIFAPKDLQLRPGDTLVLYTDGVPEAENMAHEQFHHARAITALNQAGPGQPVNALVSGLAKAVAQFAGEAPQSDDITILALRFHGARSS